MEAFFNVLKKDNKDTTTEASLILNLIDSRVPFKEGNKSKIWYVIF